MKTKYSLKSYRITINAVQEPITDKLTITTPKHAYPWLKGFFKTLDADQEHVVLLSLDAGLKVVAVKVLSSGGMAHAVIDMRVLFRNAILSGAVAIILAHNHPSERAVASKEDIAITKRVYAASKMMEIELLDHMIVAGDVIVSMATEYRKVFSE